MYQYSSTCLMINNDRLANRAVSQRPAVKGTTRPEEDIRHDLVARIRAEIAAGTYETAEKLSVALDRMIDDVT
ncbi:MAG: flagellar biosynthesis anti-sigma factor FlgM [Gemmataceae bacterium]